MRTSAKDQPSLNVTYVYKWKMFWLGSLLTMLAIILGSYVIGDEEPEEPEAVAEVLQTIPEDVKNLKLATVKTYETEINSKYNQIVNDVMAASLRHSEDVIVCSYLDGVRNVNVYYIAMEEIHNRLTKRGFTVEIDDRWLHGTEACRRVIINFK